MNEEPPAGFSSLSLDPRLLAVLGTLGYEEPTPVQRGAIPALLAGRDVLGQAATGTGKTAAFALPLIQRIAAVPILERTKPMAFILVPTRELAMQVAEAAHRYGRDLGIRVLPVYGGQSFEAQLRSLKRGVDIIVATPGRALDHIRRKTLRLDGVTAVVLDEADEMLDMGFADELEAILSELPAERQTALFSATMPPRIAAIAKKHLKAPVTIEIPRERMAAGSMPKIRQVAFIVPRSHKLAALGRVLDVEDPTSALVFCRTRNEVDQLAESLNGRGKRAEAIHGGLSQEQRDRVMSRFRAGTADLLIATDVAARGLDIKGLSHVVNYDVPSAPEAYIHRIGRTGRAGKEGVAITFAEPREHWQLRNIERLTKQHIEIDRVPTVADLKARRLELTRASLREILLAGDASGLDRFRSVIEPLVEEFDAMDVAAAALSLADGESDRTEEEVEIPTFAPPVPRPVARPVVRSARPYGTAPGPAGAPGLASKTPRARRPAVDGSKSARIFISAGRNAGVRPADLVGAITNEAGVPARSIGAIEIADRFSLVELPDDIADSVVRALKRATLRGNRITVRRDRDVE